MSIKLRVEAFTELLNRYKTIFAYHWQHRQQLSGKVLAAHEAEFLPAALSLQEKPVSPVARLLAAVLTILVAVLIAWSILGKIDIVVNASGKVIPGGYTKTIACVDVASVRALYVEEGQYVKAGDVLIELDTSSSDAERDKATGDHTMAILQVASAKALIAAIDSGRPPQFSQIATASAGKCEAERQHLDAQYRDYLAKLKRIDGDIERYNEALQLSLIHI